jgi:hypothetical protein
MNRIIAEESTLKRVNDAKPGDKSVYVNMDAIRQLPEEYEVVLTKIEFDPVNLKKDFADVGNGNWQPTPQLMYKIAEAKGIQGGERSNSEPIFQEIDINPIMCLPIDHQPTVRKMLVGKRVTKYSTVIEEDGTLRRSSPCTCEYNVWERCVELWSREEVDTNGYDPKIIKNGEYKYFDKTKNGPHYLRNNFAVELKYDSPYKRKAHFDSEMKFAQPKAETKAHEKTIRELAGLMTGYTKEDLKDGCLVFAKVRRSALVLKLETAARVDAIRNGIGQDKRPQELLFGPVGETEVRAVEPEIDFPCQAETPPPPKPTKREEMITVLKLYKKDDLIPAPHKDTVEKMLNWLNANADAEANLSFWTKCAANLKVIEESIPGVGLIAHREF